MKHRILLFMLLMKNSFLLTGQTMYSPSFTQLGYHLYYAHNCDEQFAYAMKFLSAYDLFIPELLIQYPELIDHIMR